MQGIASMGSGNASLVGGVPSGQYIPAQYQTLTGKKSYSIQSQTGRSMRCAFLGHTELARRDPSQPVSPDNMQTITPVVNPVLLQYSSGADQISAPDIVPMMALPDGNGDRFAVQNGQWGIQRRVKKVVLDGTEAWNWSDRHFAYLVLPKWAKVYEDGQTVNMYATHFTVSLDWQNYTNIAYIANWGEAVIIWPGTTITSLDAFKALLAAQTAAGTPVTLWYELLEPEFETVPAFDGYGFIEPIVPAATTKKANANMRISPENLAVISGTAVATRGYPGHVQQVQGTFYSLPNGTADEFTGVALVQKIAKVVLDGTEDWALKVVTGKYGKFFLSQNHFIKNDNAKDAYVCSHFPALHEENPWPMWNNPTFPYLATGVTSEKSLVIVAPYTSLDTFKNYLAKQKTAGMPVTVCYELAAPVTTYISADLLLADGQNTIFCDNPVMQQLTAREIDNRAVPLADEAKFYDDRLGVCPDRNLQTWLASVGRSGTFTVDPNHTADGKPDIVYGGWYMGTVHYSNDGAITAMLMTTDTTGHADNRMFRGLCVNGNWAKWQALVTADSESFQYLGRCTSGDIFDYLDTKKSGTYQCALTGGHLPPFGGMWSYGAVFYADTLKLAFLLPWNDGSDGIYYAAKKQTKWNEWQELAVTKSAELTLLNGWKTSAMSPSYALTVTISGYIAILTGIICGGTNTTGTLVANLPAFAVPKKMQNVTVKNGSFVIRPDGTLKIGYPIEGEESDVIIYLPYSLK